MAPGAPRDSAPWVAATRSCVLGREAQPPELLVNILSLLTEQSPDRSLKPQPTEHPFLSARKDMCGGAGTRTRQPSPA